MPTEVMASAPRLSAMAIQQPGTVHVIGLTGSFGSGCSYVADNILASEGRYKKLSLSDILRSRFKKDTGKDPGDCPRHELQEFGDKLRLNEGSEILVKEVLKEIQKQGETDTKWVVDSIKNPAEVLALREFSRYFFLFGVYAGKETRWQRVKTKYEDDRNAFERDDTKDTGRESPGHGQRVGDCFSEADVVLKNPKHIEVVGSDAFESLAGRVTQYAELVVRPLTKKQPPRKEEALMAMAYAVSQRSSCIKRKVGCVIVDGSGNAISSGFNEVPGHEMPCQKKYVACHRDWLCKQFFDSLKGEVPAVEGHEDRLKELFRGQFKILDYCRALHAEENAIVNLARNGRSVPLDQCTLYTTTYPCRLCANKIVNIGIKRVVYLEPYPDQEAKVILKEAGVDDEFFEGVTFKAYFRIYGEEK